MYSRETAVATFWARIYIAGDLATIEQACREECYEGVRDLARGLCVTVEPLTFIYTGGEESGAVVGLIQYPRFPVPVEQIEQRAMALAATLTRRCCQKSALVMTPMKTTWISNGKHSTDSQLAK